MDTNNPTQVYRSDCKYTRETVEAALIYSATTIQNNTASVSVMNNDLVVSFICHATKLHWHNLLSCVPPFKEESVPRKRRYLLENATTTSSPSGASPGLPVASHTRAGVRQRGVREVNPSENTRPPDPAITAAPRVTRSTRRILERASQVMQ